MAAATPAWARGIPETAVLVIGAFTNPEADAEDHVHRRTTRRTASSALNLTSMRQDAQRPMPAITRGILPPCLPTIRPDKGGKSMVMAAIGRVSIPACSGESPRTSWR